MLRLLGLGQHSSVVSRALTRRGSAFAPLRYVLRQSIDMLKLGLRCSNANTIDISHELAKVRIRKIRGYN